MDNLYYLCPDKTLKTEDMVQINDGKLLVHFIFIYDLPVTPKFISEQLTYEQVDKLLSLKGRELREYAFELTDFDVLARRKVDYLDWMVSGLCRDRKVVKEYFGDKLKNFG